VHCATTTSEAIHNRVRGFTDSIAQCSPASHVDRLGCENRPTAIFSLSQHSTLLSLSELRKRAISIPEQVALVGFDDADWMQTTWPSITAVSQPIDSMAQQAVNTLLARLTQTSDAFPVQHLERCALQIRESTQIDTTDNIVRYSVEN